MTSEYYHLSRSSTADLIVTSTDERAKDTERFFSPRIPVESYAEKTIHRICIAPTVWQCAFTVPVKPNKAENFFIYRLLAIGAYKSTLSDTADADRLDEHWLNDDIIQEKNGGEISIQYCGWLENNRELQTNIAIYSQKLRSGRYSAEPEIRLWQMNPGHNGVHWTWTGSQQS